MDKLINRKSWQEALAWLAFLIVASMAGALLAAWLSIIVR